MRSSTLGAENNIELFCFDFDSAIAVSAVSSTEKTGSGITMRGDFHEWESLFGALTKNGKKIAIIANTRSDLVSGYLKARFPQSVMKHVYVISSLQKTRGFDLTVAMGMCQVRDKNHVVLIDGDRGNIALANAAGFCTILAPNDNMKDAPHIKSVYELAGLLAPTSQKMESKKEKEKETEIKHARSKENEWASLVNNGVEFIKQWNKCKDEEEYADIGTLTFLESVLVSGLSEFEDDFKLINFQEAVIVELKKQKQPIYNENDILEIRSLIQNKYLESFKRPKLALYNSF